MHIGMAGLGRMGLNMAKRLIAGGHAVSGFDMSDKTVKAAEADGLKPAHTLEELVKSLPSPKIIWLMIPAGRPVDEAIKNLTPLMTNGDVIIDGGNSNFKDDIRREGELKTHGIRYMDVGTSGGIWGLQNGYCLMYGGDIPTAELMKPIFDTLAPPGGHLHCGAIGSGHYVKMVHNGIEYGMMQAYGEGFELLKASRYGDGLNFKNIATLWNKGSVVRSWLLELLEDAFEKEPRLASLSSYVEDSGEGRWTVLEAIENGVSMPVITESLFRRFRSRDDSNFAEKVLAALRAEFGGHAVKTEKQEGSKK